MTIVEPKTKYTIIRKLKNRTTHELNKRFNKLINRESRLFRSITADNSTEFNQFKKIEAATGTKFYFSNPYHSWERGLNENTNGLIRQYLPKRKSMSHLTQKDWGDIATKINRRPRKTLDFKNTGTMLCVIRKIVALKMRV